MKKTFRLVSDSARLMAARELQRSKDGTWVTFDDEDKRSLEQNAAQWPYLEAWAQGKEACINGQMVKATPDDWKDILTGAYSGETRMAAFDGKVIMLPQRTSKMGKKVFGEWMDFLIAVTAQAGLEPVYKNGMQNEGSK